LKDSKNFHDDHDTIGYYFVKPFFSKFFNFIFFPTNLAPIAHNVPAVYDVLAARIWALLRKDQGRQNVGGVSRGNGA
jgi:hypothetical protein